MAGSLGLSGNQFHIAGPVTEAIQIDLLTYLLLLKKDTQRDY